MTIYNFTDSAFRSPGSEAKVRSVIDGLKDDSVVFVPEGRTGLLKDCGKGLRILGGSTAEAGTKAAGEGASVLEIWTGSCGFMTADPGIIRTSYLIGELSFDEAMELCNFGARTIDPTSLYPLKGTDVEVHIRNINDPGAKGTVIRERAGDSGRAVTGVASIDDISLLTFGGTSMVGIVGVDGRLFSALSRKGISVFFVAQSSSETSICIGIKSSDADAARNAVNSEFSTEISEGKAFDVSVEDGLATVAIVGKGLKHSKGVAAKLFSTLGRNGINVVACAQGSSAHNISLIIDRNFLRKALNVIHDSFFLSEYQELNLFVCGVGTVGGSLLDQLASQRGKLMKEKNLKLNVVGIARRSRCVFSRDGIDPGRWREILQEGTPRDLEGLRDEVTGMNIINSVFVDCTASDEIASLYADFLEHNISVVAANKVAASSDYAIYSSLKDLARKRGVKYLFETNVGAGLPIISTINALRNSGDRILRIEAVLSGTLNFIFNTLSADIPFSRTVRMAMEEGFSEPDPRIDLSGKDVIRKLVILAREAGYKVNQEDVEADLFIPKDFFDCTMDEFWERLPSLDADFEKRRKVLENEHKRWRFVARMEDGRFSVSLREFAEGHSFYVLDGSNNIILLTTERYNRHPMLIQGYGAGAEVTAAGVFDDIISIANI